jgi:hypothetical protein
MRWCVAVLAAGIPLAQACADEDFEKHVRPLLSAHCIKCHGPKKQSGGLRLDSRAALLEGGESGPAVAPGKPRQSLLITAVNRVGDVKMPPRGKLSANEIEKLTRWVARGAPWPNPGKTPAFEASDIQRKWWSFQPIRTARVPANKDPNWALSDLDRFILAELETRSIAPAKFADRRSLLRRVTFDLTGLPPTLEEAEAFIKDDSPDAFAKVVDRLLASPAYGERWARHWLDVVRYADYHDGNPGARTASCEPLNAWRYRDWVVRALNGNLPFNRFIVHQIAGDLLPSPNGREIYPDGLIASTFLTNGAWDRGDADKEKMVSDMVEDQVDTIGKAFMGLTLGCARCHDHKFDPVTQADYYGLAGIFYSTRILKEVGTKGGEYTLQRIPLVPRAYLERRNDQLAWIAGVEKKLADLDRQNPNPASNDPARLALARTRDRLRRELLPDPPVAEAAQEGGTPSGLFPNIQDVRIHIRGSYTRLGPVVPRGMPRFLAGEKQPAINRGSGRRELANWIASKDNPLTARVIVNRVWQWHFGSGLVNTPNNFGLLAQPPSHPKLLDWLALRFMEEGWSLKKLHRRILLSATYQQSSRVSRDQFARDPENRWLGRFTPRRLEAEAIRDAMLFVAGQLDRTPGGPATHDVNSFRRSLFLQTARWDRSNFAALFDAANPDASVEKRDVSTVAPQALFLINHDFVLTQAKSLANRIKRDPSKDQNPRIQRLFALLFSRPAAETEVRLAQSLLARLGKGESETAWRDLAHVLLCTNEFLYVD